MATRQTLSRVFIRADIMKIIYKATSKTTGKKYIGQTTQSLERRKEQHESNARINLDESNHFYRAIRKYGFNDFVFEVVESSLEINLDEREKYWIKYYDSYNNGYNSTLGGEGATRNDSLILKLFNQNFTTKKIMEKTGYNHSTVLRAYKVLGLKEKNVHRNKIAASKLHSYVIEQYSLSGDFIKEWSSLKQAGEYFGSRSMIASVCDQGKSVSAYGFIFKKKEDPRPIQEWVDRYRNRRGGAKSIIQLDLNLNIINHFSSAAEAARHLDIKDSSNIRKAIKFDRKAYGYYWKDTWRDDKNYKECTWEQII